MQSKRSGAEEASSGGTEAPVKEAPLWVYLGLVVAGVGCDWYFAFKWFFGQYSYWSGPVLRGMVLTGMLCALIAIVAGRAKWREAAQIFLALSWALCGYMMIDRGWGWSSQPRWKN